MCSVMNAKFVFSFEENLVLHRKSWPTEAKRSLLLTSIGLMFPCVCTHAFYLVLTIPIICVLYTRLTHRIDLTKSNVFDCIADQYYKCRYVSKRCVELSNLAWIQWWHLWRVMYHLLLNFKLTNTVGFIHATRFVKHLNSNDKIFQGATTFIMKKPFLWKVARLLHSYREGKTHYFLLGAVGLAALFLGILLRIVAVVLNSTKCFWSILSCNLAKKCCSKKHQQRSEKLKLWITILCSPAIQCVRQRQRCSK